jgi:hypothetical protein
MVGAGFRYDVVTTPGRAQQARPGARGCSSMAERQLPKLIVRVRFSSPAPRKKPRQRRLPVSLGLSRSVIDTEFLAISHILSRGSRAEQRGDGVAGGFQVTRQDPDVVLERGRAAVGVPAQAETTAIGTWPELSR